MALKDRVQKRVDGLKVEGDWRMKFAVYGGALLVVGTILLVMYLLIGRIGSGPPEVGAVTITSQGEEVAPLANQIYTTEKGQRQEGRRLVPAEVGDSAPTVAFDHSTTVHFEGGSNSDGFAFTIYTGEGRVYTDTLESFVCPRVPGKYLVCEECYWGTNRQNIGMEYYFWIEVGQDYIDHLEGE